MEEEEEEEEEVAAHRHSPPFATLGMPEIIGQTADRNAAARSCPSAQTPPFHTHTH